MKIRSVNNDASTRLDRIKPILETVVIDGQAEQKDIERGYVKKIGHKRGFTYLLIEGYKTSSASYHFNWLKSHLFCAVDYLHRPAGSITIKH